MNGKIRVAFGLPLLVCALLAPSRSGAIPAFARKYETSCLTCHTIYPRLNPFGEAFRRDGYRFPGVDSDYVKQGTIALGQEAQKKTFPKAVWPATIPSSLPMAIGVNGQSLWYPVGSASVPRQNARTAGLFLDDMVAEGHLWTGAALDDKTTLWGELTLSSDGTVDVEHAQVLLNDLFGPRHLTNLTVGRGFPTLTSFGPHSSYLGDSRFTNLPVTGIFAVSAAGSPLSSDPFVLVDNYNGMELTGVMMGQLDYSVGLVTGKNPSSVKFATENVYGHVGYKVGGMRLDGEGSQGPADAMRPWAERSVTVDLFAFHSREFFDNPDGVGDTSTTVGAAARGQLGSLELDLGYYAQRHTRANGSLDSVWADAQWAELSYVLFPWMVPAIRVERLGLRPAGAPDVSDLHLMPGVAFLLRPNVKAVLVGNVESVNGFAGDSTGAPLGWSGGNADWGGFVASPRATAGLSSHMGELESIALFLAWAN